MDYPGSTIFTPQIADAFDDRGWEVFQEQIPGKGHGQFISLNRGLTQIFHDLGFPVAEFLSQGTPALAGRLRSLEDRFGIPLGPTQLFTETEMVFHGCGLMGQNRHLEAQELLRYALALYPDSPRILYRLGQAMVFGGEEAEGRATLQRAVELDGNGGIAGMVELWLMEWEGSAGGSLPMP